MLSLTEFVWEFQNNALWDTHQNALLKAMMPVFVLANGSSTILYQKEATRNIL